jgi:TolB-like protein
VNPKNFLSELKRRNVYKVAIAYAVVAWLLLQAASILFPTFEAPSWTMKVFVVVVALGFPIALIIAWAFELTPEGIKRTDEIEPRLRSRNRAWIYVVVIAGAISVGLFFLGRYTVPTKLSASANAAAKSIAVLPFENLSEDKANAYFADGIQEEILTRLAKIADLKVISRTSVMQYKSGVKRNLRQIANELGVAHVVEGSVQRAGNRVRVSAQLIDAKTDTHLWVERYDRPLDDVFGIQSEIAKAIATQLQAKLSPAEKAAIEQPPTTDLVAYDRYVRAKKLFEDAATPRIFEHVRQGIQLLNQAVAHDPTFLLAYCELARAHAYLYFLGVDHTAARVALAKEARDAALRLSPERGETHLAAAWVAYHCYLDYETALSEVAIARRGLPNDASIFDITAFITRRQGQWKQCTRNLERAAELDPRSMRLLVTGAADTYQFMRSFSDMAAALDRALVVAPGDANTRVARAFVDLKSRADTEPAHKVIQNIVLEDPSAVYVIAEQWLDLALCRRDAAEMASALASLSTEGIVFLTYECLARFVLGWSRGRETMRLLPKPNLLPRAARWKRLCASSPIMRKPSASLG